MKRNLSEQEIELTNKGIDRVEEELKSDERALEMTIKHKER